MRSCDNKPGIPMKLEGSEQQSIFIPHCNQRIKIDRKTGSREIPTSSIELGGGLGAGWVGLLNLESVVTVTVETQL